MTEIDGTPRERLDDTFTSPYPNEDDSTRWDALLYAISQEFEAMDTTRVDIEDSKFVGDATGEQLDKLATIFQKERRSDEALEEFRARLKVGLQEQITSATPGQIHQVAAVLLDAPLSAVRVVEPNQNRPFFQIAIDTEETGQLPIDPEVLSDIVENVSAVGVRVGVNVFIGADGVMVLTGAPSTNTTTNDEGLSSVNLEPLSTGNWTLSRQ